MATKIERRGGRVTGCRMALALGVMLCGVGAISPLRAETVGDCSWAGPDPDWILDRPLPAVDLVGSLGSEFIDLLYEAKAPIAFISMATEDPEVRFQRSEATTVRDLLDEVLAQTPGYRLEVVGGKLVIYPFEGGFDALVDLGNPREETREAAWFSVSRELSSKVPELHDFRAIHGRRSGGSWIDEISVGGARTVVEHLVSLAAGSPSVTFLMVPGRTGAMRLYLTWIQVIEDILPEAPGKVKVGEVFQVVPRVILAGGTPVTLIGPGCGVEYHNSDESILKIDQTGRAVAVGKGSDGFSAFYQATGVFVDVEVTDE